MTLCTELVCQHQVAEKAARKAAEAARQRELDAAMEADRVAALREYQVRLDGQRTCEPASVREWAQHQQPTPQLPARYTSPNMQSQH